MAKVNQDIAPFVSDWNRGLIRSLKRNLKRFKIGESGTLERGLKGQTKTTTTQVISEVAMPVQGRFVDMGAGKGQTARQARLARRTARKRKPWYSKTTYGSLNTLQGGIGFTVSNGVLADFKKQSPKKIIF